MTLTPTTKSLPNPVTHAAQTESTIASDSPYFFVTFDPGTKAIIGKTQYRSNGNTRTVRGILACDTYANLQAAKTAAALTGTLSPDPTPKV